MPPRANNSLALTLCSLLLAMLPALAASQSAGPVTLAQAQATRERIRSERRQGNAEAAWNLEQELLTLVVRYPEDVQSARILRDTADHRIDTLAQYDTGGFPPEIVLGCYYNSAPQFSDISQRGSQSLTAGPGSNAGRDTCATGSRSTARRSLAEEALALYIESARIFVDIDNGAGDEVRELFMKLLETSYRTANYAIGRQSLQTLIRLQEENSETWQVRGQTLAFLGDWDLLFAQYFGSKYVDSATASYEQALALLAEHGVGEDTVDSIFAPQIPVLLPAFLSNRLISEQTDDAAGHIDVSFEIDDGGKSTRIRVLDSSSDVSRAETRDLVNMIRQGRFRPIAENGHLLESAPVTIRYYINN